MGSIVLDSSVLIALLNAGDKHHVAAREAIKNKNIFFVSAISFAEVLHESDKKFIKQNFDVKLTEVYQCTEMVFGDGDDDGQYDQGVGD